MDLNCKKGYERCLEEDYELSKASGLSILAEERNVASSVEDPH
jgi:hypothetical protein